MSPIARQFSRQVLPDGRNSMRHFLFAPHQVPVLQTFKKHMVESGTWPLLLCVGVGVGIGVVTGIHSLLYCPDVCIDKTKRKTTIRQNEDEARRWVRHHDSIRNLTKIAKLVDDDWVKEVNPPATAALPSLDKVR